MTQVAMTWDPRDRERYHEGLRPLEEEINDLFRTTTLLPYIALAPRAEQDAVFEVQLAKARNALDQAEVIHGRAKEYRESFVAIYPLIPLAQA